MAKAPMRRGGSEDGEVDKVAKGIVVVIVRLSNGKEITLNPDEGAHLIEEEDKFVINYLSDPHPTVTVSRAGEVVHSESVPAENIKSIPSRMFS